MVPIFMLLGIEALPALRRNEYATIKLVKFLRERGVAGHVLR
jgi:hypothetical protein